jgi:hypothetical protein
MINGDYQCSYINVVQCYCLQIDTVLEIWILDESKVKKNNTVGNEKHHNPQAL